MRNEKNDEMSIELEIENLKNFIAKAKLQIGEYFYIREVCANESVDGTNLIEIIARLYEMQMRMQTKEEMLALEKCFFCRIFYDNGKQIRIE